MKYVMQCTQLREVVVTFGVEAANESEARNKANQAVALGVLTADNIRTPPIAEQEVMRQQKGLRIASAGADTFPIISTSVHEQRNAALALRVCKGLINACTHGQKARDGKLPGLSILRQFALEAVGQEQAA